MRIETKADMDEFVEKAHKKGHKHVAHWIVYRRYFGWLRWPRDVVAYGACDAAYQRLAAEAADKEGEAAVRSIVRH